MQRTAQFFKSKVRCLVRHRGGNYYASTKVAGKLVRRHLGRDDVISIGPNGVSGIVSTLIGSVAKKGSFPAPVARCRSSAPSEE